jgi:hypothetical protein
VSLWKETMVSQGCDCGERDFSSVLRGQASPSGTPSMLVRVAGQIGARPSIRTDHRVGRGMMGMEDARVLG